MFEHLRSMAGTPQAVFGIGVAGRNVAARPGRLAVLPRPDSRRRGKGARALRAAGEIGFGPAGPNAEGLT
jgi:hypothetical protein